MDNLLQEIIGKDVSHSIKLSGGFSFDTWLVELTDGKKLIFRTGDDREVDNGKKSVAADIFVKENFFYETVNDLLPGLCPEIFLIDNTKVKHNLAYQIMSYMDGLTLDQYFKNIVEVEKESIQYELGKIISQINNIEIEDYPASLNRNTSWDVHFKRKLIERLNPLVDTNLLSEHDKVFLIKKLEEINSVNNQSLLHLDVRLPNVIYNKERIHLIDAENCEIGDPLYELAITSVAGVMTKSFLEGYMSITNYDLDVNSIRFKFYQLERQAGLVILFKNIVKNDDYYAIALKAFEKNKNAILFA